jgi:hypothetical protein
MCAAIGARGHAHCRVGTAAHEASAHAARKSGDDDRSGAAPLRVGIARIDPVRTPFLRADHVPVLLDQLDAMLAAERRKRELRAVNNFQRDAVLAYHAQQLGMPEASDTSAATAAAAPGSKAEEALGRSDAETLEQFLEHNWWDADLDTRERFMERMYAKLMSVVYHRMQIPPVTNGTLSPQEIERYRKLILAGENHRTIMGRELERLHQQMAPGEPQTKRARTRAPRPKRKAAAPRSKRKATSSSPSSSSPPSFVDDMDDLYIDSDSSSSSSSSSAAAAVVSDSSRSRAAKTKSEAERTLRARLEIVREALHESGADEIDKSDIPWTVRYEAAQSLLARSSPDAEELMSNMPSVSALLTTVEWLRNQLVELRDERAALAASSGRAFGEPDAEERVDAFKEWLSALRFMRSAVERAGGAFEPRLLSEGTEITAVNAVEMAVLTPLRAPIIAKFMAMAPSNVLLYGPGGTGKTQMAYAMALGVAVPLIAVSATSFQSPFQAESKLVLVRILERAHTVSASLGKLSGARAGCFVLLDEVDGVLGDAAAKQETSIVEVFKQRVQPGELSDAPVVYVGTTNHPYAITDPGVMRRFPLQFYMGLPSDVARVRIFGETLARHFAASTAAALPAIRAFVAARAEDIARSTEGYSHGELVAALDVASSAHIASELASARFTVSSVPGSGSNVVTVGKFDPDASMSRRRGGSAAAARADSGLSAQEVERVLARMEQGGQQIDAMRIDLAPPNMDALVSSLMSGTLAPRNTTPGTLMRYAQYASARGDARSEADIKRDLDRVKTWRAKQGLDS